MRPIYIQRLAAELSTLATRGSDTIVAGLAGFLSTFKNVTVSAGRVDSLVAAELSLNSVA